MQHSRYILFIAFFAWSLAPATAQRGTRVQLQQLEKSTAEGQMIVAKPDSVAAWNALITFDSFDLMLNTIRIGRGAANNITNTVFGYQAGDSITTAIGSVFIGYQAGLNNTTANSNVFIGAFSGDANTIGDLNIFIGTGAGTANTEGKENIFSGYLAGGGNISGSYNIFQGRSAGQSNAVGNYNIYQGFQAGFSTDSASYNIAQGYSAGRIVDGDYNIMQGFEAGYNTTTASRNVFQGYQAGYNSTTGSYNTFQGYQAGYNNAAGEYRVAIGYKSSRDSTFDNTITIGREVEASEAGEIVIGNVAYSTTARIATDSFLVLPTGPTLTGGEAGGIRWSTDSVYFEGHNGTAWFELMSRDSTAALIADSLATLTAPGDNLGDHIMDQNLQTNGNWISGDGGDEGLYVDADGHVGIGDQPIVSGLSIVDYTNTVDDTLIIHSATWDFGNTIDITAGKTGNIRMGSFDLVANTFYGAKFQMFSDYASNYKGQLFFDSGNDANAGIFFRTLTSPTTVVTRMKIAKNGDVAIGANAPAYILDINGDNAVRFPSPTSTQRTALTGAVGLLTYDETVNEFFRYGGAGTPGWDTLATRGWVINTYGSGSGIGDADYGDITVSGGGTVWNIDTDAVGASEIAANAVGSSELASTSVTPGSYTNASFTVDADGRLTAASSGAGGGNHYSYISDGVTATAAVSTDTIDFAAAGTPLTVAVSGDQVTYTLDDDLSQYDNTTSGFLTSEVDGSTTNEGSLTVGAGTATTSLINSNTSGSTAVTIEVATPGLSIAEASNTITLTNTGDTDASDDLTTTTSFSGDVTGEYDNMQIAANAVGSTEIATGAVGSDEIATDAVGAAEISAGAVGASELASTTVSAGSYTHASITVDEDGRITSASNGVFSGLGGIYSGSGTLSNSVVISGENGATDYSFTINSVDSFVVSNVNESDGNTTFIMSGDEARFIGASFVAQSALETTAALTLSSYGDSTQFSRNAEYLLGVTSNGTVVEANSNIVTDCVSFSYDSGSLEHRYVHGLSWTPVGGIIQWNGEAGNFNGNVIYSGSTSTYIYAKVYNASTGATVTSANLNLCYIVWKK